MRIYIAGPLTASTELEEEANVARAFDAGLVVLGRGHAVYIPHLDFYMQKRPGCKIRGNDWLKHDFKWLEVCDGLLFLESSPGADLELAKAKELGLRIFYLLLEIPDESNRR